MSRLIDADALKEFFHEDDGKGEWTYNIAVNAYIDASPTIGE